MATANNRRVISYAGDAHDATIIDQIMLRFRPIAPKPAAGAPDSDLGFVRSKDVLLSKRRKKRKYVRVCTDKRIRKNSRVSASSDQQNEKERKTGDLVAEAVVTLQLLPDESYQSTKSPGRDRSWCNQELTHGGGNLKVRPPAAEDGVDRGAAAPVSKTNLESVITVEYVTDAYDRMGIGGGRGLGLTDVERVKNLEEEARPGFISDGSDRVRWMNGAYGRMAVAMKEGNEKANSVQIIACLVTNQKLLPFVYCSAFTCWVRLQHRFGGNGKSSSKMVPCDVWRMDCGGFAWRLDIEAALSLSLGH